MTLTIMPQSVEAGTDESISTFAEILLLVGAGQAVFFALFAGQFGILSILQERREWTLQRLLVSPTSRFEILTGKLIGTYAIVIFQIVIMLTALTLVASLVEGGLYSIWGTNIVAIAGVVLSLALVVCGIGLLFSSIAKTPEQAGTFGMVVNLILAVFGGAFSDPLPSPFRDLSLVYWGVDALNNLAHGDTDILLHMVVLVGQGAVFFFIGLWLFNRRVDV